MIKKFASLPSVIKGKWALATPKTKKGIITGAVSVALLSTCIGGCAMNQAKNNDSTAPATTTEAQTETQDDSYGVISGSDVKDDEDSINFISDNLNISGLTIVSTQDSQSIADEIVPPTGDFDLDSDEYTIDPTTETEVEVDGDYYIAPDGTVWLTEQDYLDYINSQNTTEENPTVVEQEDDGFYHAPDGSVWATEQDYLDYINGQNTGGNEENPSQDTPVENPTENNDGSYRAPDGSYWSSEQDYLDYINGQQVDTSSYYTAPDGSLWESEAAYLEYINGYDMHIMIYEDEEVVINEDTTGYTAPDGTVWSSEQDYLDFVGGNQETSTLYEAPDGSYWTSEAEYNAYIKMASETTEVKTEENTEVKTEENTAETGKGDETEETTYFVDPEGNYWTSEAEYNAYVAMQQETVKTK